MKPNHVLWLAFLTATSTALAQAQTAKTPPTKKATTPAQKNPAQQLPFADARNMTVILLYAPPGTFSKSTGSGVWIGKHGYIVTCWHVIATSPDSFKIGIARDPYVAEGPINLSIGAGASLIDAKLVAHDEDTDVAILKSDKTPDQVWLEPTVAFLGPGKPPTPITPQTPISPKGATLKTELPKPGETLLLAGFPLGEDTLVLQTGVATGFHSNPARPHSPPSTSLRIMLSLVSNPGNSGGPVLDADGKVVGLLEGNLQSPIRDEKGTTLTYKRPMLNPNGQPVLGVNNQPVLEDAPLLQNSGISIAVPARFIAELAKNKNISLD